MITPSVYSYWTGPKPTWIALCQETLLRNSPTVRILDRTWWTSGEYSGPVPAETILRQRPNVQSDYLRAWLLQQHRAIWVDADCIVFRDLQPLADHLDAYDFVAYRSARQLCSALISGQPGSRVGRVYLDLMTARLSSGRLMRPLELGPYRLEEAIRAVGPDQVYMLPARLCHPLHWPQRNKMATPGKPVLDPAIYTWMMGHRWLGFLRGANREQILASQTWTGWLFRKALGLA